MKPISPIYKPAIDYWGMKETVFAKHQPEYIQLPALKFSDGLVMSRWKLSFFERLKVLLTGDIFIGLLTFNTPPQPIRLSTTALDICNDSSEYQKMQCPQCNGLGTDPRNATQDCTVCDGDGTIGRNEL